VARKGNVVEILVTVGNEPTFSHQQHQQKAERNSGNVCCWQVVVLCERCRRRRRCCGWILGYATSLGL
jgi:hypothetical protein